MRDFLAEEAEEQTTILRTLRGRLQRGMDAAERQNPHATEPPSREWVRAFAMYLDGFRTLANMEIEHAKLQLLARRLNGKQPPMSDAEYEAQLQALGRDALDTMSAEELEAALTRKRALVVAPGEHEN